MTKPKKNPAAVALGALGGAAGKGEAKRRSAEQCRQAALKRWADHPEDRAKGPRGGAPEKTAEAGDGGTVL